MSTSPCNYPDNIPYRKTSYKQITKGSAVAFWAQEGLKGPQAPCLPEITSRSLYPPVYSRLPHRTPLGAHGLTHSLNTRILAPNLAGGPLNPLPSKWGQLLGCGMALAATARHKKTPPVFGRAAFMFSFASIDCYLLCVVVNPKGNNKPPDFKIRGLFFLCRHGITPRLIPE